MGRDKALVQLGGRLLVEYSIGVLYEVGLPGSIAGGDPSLARYAPLVKDASPGLGPLGGVCCALAGTSKAWAVFLSVDLPLLPVSLIDCL